MQTRIYYLEKNSIPFYIGKTINVSLRSRNHKKKYGDDVELIVIDETWNEDWKFWEIYWIDQFKSWGFILLNKNKGGGGVSNHSIQTKLKIGLSNSKPKPEGFKDKLIGKKHKQSTIEKLKLKKNSIEARKLISEGNKGKSKNCIKVFQYNLEGIFVKEWKSMKDASITLNIQINSISLCCKRKTKQAGGYIWDYQKIKIEPYQKVISASKGHVLQWDLNGELIKEWENGKTAAKSLKICYNSLNTCCNGKTKTCGGFKWTYKS